MRYIRIFGVLLLVPALACFFAASGCGGKPDKDKKPRRHHSEDDDDTGGSDVKKGGDSSSDGGKTALESKGWGTLKGVVTLDGPVPNAASFVTAMENQKDKERCLMGPKTDRTWIVNAKKMVKNVVIWLDPGEGKYFKIDPAKNTWDKVVFIDQPYCAFQPRVQVFFPKYFNGTEMVKGQDFLVKNSATIPHNASYQGGQKTNPGTNVLVPPGTSSSLTTLKPDPKTPITFSCQIHTWMRGKVWALDNPFFASTDENGKFEIKNAPAGVEVKVIAWHEATGFVPLSNGGKIKLEDGKPTELNFTVKAP